MKRRIISLVLLVIMLVSAVVISPMSISAATPSSTVKTSSTLAYTLKGLKYNRAVQNFYIGAKHIYVTQRADDTTYISRLVKDDATKTATYRDHMTILRGGHGQALDLYTYKGVDYFYCAVKAETTTGSSFSVQIARIKYNAGETYDYTDLNRFTNLNLANPTGKSLGSTIRVAAGGNSAYTIFRIQTLEDTVTYSIYDTEKINAVLDANKTVKMNNAKIKAACVKTFTQKGSDIIRPNGSFQGVDMRSYKKIYVTGGINGNVPMLARMSNTGAFKKLVKITDVGKSEIEGVQCKDSRLYFIIIPNPTSKRDTQQIRYIPESVAD